MYAVNGNKVEFAGEVQAVTANAKAAERAVYLLNRSRVENDQKRQYTKAARSIAEAECVEGFEWVGVDRAS